MTPEESSVFDALPSALIVYRGAGERNKNGASWSLSKEVADRFPRGPRYSVADPTLYSAHVQKDRVLAVKLARKEAEVITFAARIFAAERIIITASP
jgi:hypothetical protein